MKELFGKLVLLLRKRKGESLERFGDNCGYTDGSYMCKVEHGKANVDAELIEKICKDSKFEITALKGKFEDGEEVWIEEEKKE